MSHSEGSANLERLQDSVNGWLRYAELKNGALLTWSTTVSLAVLSWLTSHTGPAPLGLVESARVAVVGGAVATVLMLISFTPVLSPLRRILPRTKQPGNDDNPLFFGDIAKHSVAGFKPVWREASGSTLTRYDEFVIEQVVTNAKIALAKNQLFMASAVVMLVAALLCAGACVTYAC